MLTPPPVFICFLPIQKPKVDLWKQKSHSMLQMWLSFHFSQAVFQSLSIAPVLSSSYMAHPGGICHIGHIRRLSTAFLKQKSPAQEGRAEGLPSRNHIIRCPLSMPPPLEGLQWFCDHLASQRAARVVGSLLWCCQYLCFSFLIPSLQQQLKTTTDGQQDKILPEAMHLCQAP